jgi:branched-chain amino acid transport system substrate-binding protein
MKRFWVSILAAFCAGVFAQGAPIKIGEINSYSSMPQFTTPYRQGWQLAVEEINAKGGLAGPQGGSRCAG